MRSIRPIDRNGTSIGIGDVVRIVGIPDLTGMSPDCLAESLPAFQHLVGKYKRIRGFGDDGCAEFSFTIRDSDGKRRRHFVWIEPFLLHVPRQRRPQRSEGIR